ncbi:hypothetical protein JTE90_018146 [Oedothorax gibbosus]|uniref:Uncharacterized protein n=1 Tax=Oedothorax gibbosus TaxID=931172 RepID=A0AAV6TH79_9ARAC|nr:hypothetical protein JTE90_014841 [Oedothorax gibbosus]KAG8171523.1 hypothetical protein JTE90_012036 [Oedothorax gibbosus]KAG8172449.1 hypothetical protein JTE90_018146 [Oedothorax gibbosus]
MVQPTSRHRRSGQEGEPSRASTSTGEESSSRHEPRARCQSKGVAGGGSRRGTERLSRFQKSQARSGLKEARTASRQRRSGSLDSAQEKGGDSEQGQEQHTKGIEKIGTQR